MAYQDLGLGMSMPVLVDRTLLHGNVEKKNIYNQHIFETNGFICDGIANTMGFQVDREIDLCGVSFFGPTKGSGFYYVCIRVSRDDGTESKLLCNLTTVVYANQNETFTVPIGTIRLTPTKRGKSFQNGSYEIVYSLQGKETQRLSLEGNEMVSTRVQNCNINFQRSVGQISDFIFLHDSQQQEFERKPVVARLGNIPEEELELVSSTLSDPVTSTPAAQKSVDTRGADDSGIFSPESSSVQPTDSKQVRQLAELVQDISPIRPTRGRSDIIHSPAKEYASQCDVATDKVSVVDEKANEDKNLSNAASASDSDKKGLIPDIRVKMGTRVDDSSHPEYKLFQSAKKKSKEVSKQDNSSN